MPEVSSRFAGRILSWSWCIIDKRRDDENTGSAGEKLPRSVKLLPVLSNILSWEHIRLIGLPGYDVREGAGGVPVVPKYIGYLLRYENDFRLRQCFLRFRITVSETGIFKVQAEESFSILKTCKSHALGAAADALCWQGSSILEDGQFIGSARFGLHCKCPVWIAVFDFIRDKKSSAPYNALNRWILRSLQSFGLCNWLSISLSQHCTSESKSKECIYLLLRWRACYLDIEVSAPWGLLFEEPTTTTPRGSPAAGTDQHCQLPVEHPKELYRPGKHRLPQAIGIPGLWLTTATATATAAYCLPFFRGVENCSNKTKENISRAQAPYVGGEPGGWPGPLPPNYTLRRPVFARNKGHTTTSREEIMQSRILTQIVRVHQKPNLQVASAVKSERKAVQRNSNKARKNKADIQRRLRVRTRALDRSLVSLCCRTEVVVPERTSSKDKQKLLNRAINNRQPHGFHLRVLLLHPFSRSKLLGISSISSSSRCLCFSSLPLPNEAAFFRDNFDCRRPLTGTPEDLTSIYTGIAGGPFFAACRLMTEFAVIVAEWPIYSNFQTAASETVYGLSYFRSPHDFANSFSRSNSSPRWITFCDSPLLIKRRWAEQVMCFVFHSLRDLLNKMCVSCSTRSKYSYAPKTHAVGNYVSRRKTSVTPNLQAGGFMHKTDGITSQLPLPRPSLPVIGRLSPCP
ncbi:hypothetical protein MBM_07958 [Drepanopeziza brunnea f. sp. 'multigermtubi' MB_m1]|uniref:Uncharacterized protein n=1 Tax=Marssonina brunnea f. sp. multigermtubi (strain MB_m1) TaxID=1072389 RepID=K1WN57_MARBU|nr:uncharacterized protein MBM_07958 [Drepanopeziza brunnea f. sp. 'multigermtubi' MB_m1]EKD13757.1 hypothetical protein MBM_07958 [Drepanopeziza brunnea f. sp. 'multigermtubi' MB_m1]